MKENHNLIAEAEKLLAECSDTSLATLDIDAITQWMQRAKQELETSAAAASELSVLRTHLVDRIAGMAKAIAAAGRNAADLREVDDFIEKLNELDATQLIKAYRRLSARFRDTFPTSFGRMRSRNPVKRDQNSENFC